MQDRILLILKEINKQPCHYSNSPDNRSNPAIRHLPFTAGMDVQTRSRNLARLSSRIADPRYYQIVTLGSLLVFGIAVLEFGIHWQHAVLITGTALLTQYFAGRLIKVAPFDPLSALITSLSLTMFLRTDQAALAVLAAFVAIGSKYLLRVKGKHIFNPANLAIVALVLGSDHAWIAAGQWGSAALGAFALACAGFIVLTRARRAETTCCFLLVYASLLFARALWLGDPLAIPLHQLQNGALLIFAFFMISDPKTTPDSRAGRALFGALVAAVAVYIQFGLFEPGAPVLALVFCSPLVPLTDALLRGTQYQWSAGPNTSLIPKTEHLHAHPDTTAYLRPECSSRSYRSSLLRLLRRQGGYRPF